MTQRFRLSGSARSQRRLLLVCGLSVMLCCLPPARLGVAATQSQPFVSLELVVEDQAAITTSHRWLQMLQDSGTSVRIRAARPGDTAEVKQAGSSSAPSYHVTGVLTRRNTLRLPGAEISYGDKSGLQRWLDKLRSGGVEGLTAKTVAFGLTEPQFKELYEQLAVAVANQTRGQPTTSILEGIQSQVPYSLSIVPAAQSAIATAAPVRDELEGVSAGTALAALLRPLGLAFMPVRGASGEVILRIDRASQLPEFWPVGWPLRENQRTDTVLPKLLQFLPVEIEDVTLDEALSVISQRLEAPLLWDHNGMAKQGIDPSTIQVALKPERTFYKKIVDRLLYQGGLRQELRVDEAGTGFLWIEPVKK